MGDIPKNQITSRNTIEQQQHEEEAKAKRVKIVHPDGSDVDSLSPLPTTATIDVDHLEVTVNLDAFTKTPPDNVEMVGTEDGTKDGVKHVAKIGSDGKLEVKDTAADASLANIDTKLGLPLPLPVGAATEAKQDDGNATLVDIDTKLGLPLPLPVGASTEAKQDAGNATLVDIDSKLASPLPLPTGAATEAKQDVANSSLASIDAKLTSPLDVSDATAQAILTAIQTQLTSGIIKVDDDQTQTLLNDIIAQLEAGTLAIGTEDGTPTGIQRVFVNNLRQQILASADRVADFTYADFGTKDQRIVQIDYTSATFPGLTVQRQFNYSLVGTRYRRDNEMWAIV